jgi:hypothetical protein
MEFRLDGAPPVLQRTLAVLRALLLDLPAVWTEATEGQGTWRPFDVGPWRAHLSILGQG